MPMLDKMLRGDVKQYPITLIEGWTFKQDDGTVEIEKGIGLAPKTSHYIADGAISLLGNMQNMIYE